MAEPPADRCGYAWPENYEIGAQPDQQSCCYRATLPDADRCAWHANPAETEYKSRSETDAGTIAVLEEARAPAAIRRQNGPPFVQLNTGHNRESAGGNYVELLDGAVLSGLNPRDAISLPGVALRSADFSGADLSDARLFGAGARLHDADLENADLRGTNLERADLRSVDLTNSNLPDAELVGADLRNAILTDAVLSGSDLTRANLENAVLVRTTSSTPT